MGTEVFMAAVFILMAFAVFDLIVGVSNDAVNFLNSAVGSKVAPRYVIMLIASLGILAGVTFSGGMMEVARKGIFNPAFFTMPELMTIFLGVMIADVILLDIFNTFGMPTSTTVSIVFELLGGAVAISVLKIVKAEGSLLALGEYINTAKAMMIIFGILFSVVVAFTAGALAQFISRLIFTFDYARRMQRYGALWGGVALASVCYFILVKGAKGTTFMSSGMVEYIKTHTLTILGFTFAGSAVLLQVLLLFKVNILKPIILLGTFALAMAFAANDLVNFIGVPMAGLHAYKAAMATGSPLTTTMGMLAHKVPSQTYMLLLAGAVMVVTLWISKKARSVTETSMSLGQQEEGTERFESSMVSRFIVRMFLALLAAVQSVTPEFIRNAVADRLDPKRYQQHAGAAGEQRFDLLRAAVNLVVASAIISFATSYKLPLSTTYVTFMVLMGASFADQAWGRESAVYRISGVLAVIGGWFLTAFSAFTLCGIIVTVIFKLGITYSIPLLLALVVIVIFKNHRKHKERSELQEADRVFNLRKVSDTGDVVSTTFVQLSFLLKEILKGQESALEGLFTQNLAILRQEGKRAKQIQNWTNIIIANVFKALRLLQAQHTDMKYRYAQIIHSLQLMVDSHRDIVQRSLEHVENHHKGMLEVQVSDLARVREMLTDILGDVAEAFGTSNPAKFTAIIEKDRQFHEISQELHKGQLDRIVDHTSKTRLSILFYAIIDASLTISKQNIKLLKVCEKSFARQVEKAE